MYISRCWNAISSPKWRAHKPLKNLHKLAPDPACVFVFSIPKQESKSRPLTCWTTRELREPEMGSSDVDSTDRGRQLEAKPAVIDAREK